MNQQQRQGDVLISAVKRIPKEAKRIPLRALALGEVTGHSHAVAKADAEKVEMYSVGDQTFLAVTKDGVSIRHEEHGTVVLDRGLYDVRIQIEETPDEVIRNVAD